MNVNRTRKWTGLLLSGAVLSSLLVTSSLAAESSASLEFQYPEDVNPAEVTITVHEGYPTASGEDAVTACPRYPKILTAASSSASPAPTAIGSEATATTTCARFST